MSLDAIFMSGMSSRNSSAPNSRPASIRKQSTEKVSKTSTPRRSMTSEYWTSPTTNFGFGAEAQLKAPISHEEIRRSMAQEYWTSPTTNFGFGAPLKAPEDHHHATKPSLKAKISKNVKKAMDKTTESYWKNAEISALYGGFAPRA